MIKEHAQSGFSLTEMLVSLGLVGITMAGIYGLTHIMARQQLQTGFNFSTEAIRREIAAHLMDDAAWEKTLADSTNRDRGAFTCLTTGDCRSISGELKFNLIDATGRTVIDTFNTSAGFTALGAPCTSNCDIRYELKWTPICPSTGPCDMKIIGTPTSGSNALPNRRLAFSAQKHELVVIHRAPSTSAPPAAKRQWTHNDTILGQPWCFTKRNTNKANDPNVSDGIVVMETRLNTNAPDASLSVWFTSSFESGEKDRRYTFWLLVDNEAVFKAVHQHRDGDGAEANVPMIWMGNLPNIGLHTIQVKMALQVGAGDTPDSDASCPFSVKDRGNVNPFQLITLIDN